MTKNHTSMDCSAATNASFHLLLLYVMGRSYLYIHIIHKTVAMIVSENMKDKCTTLYSYLAHFN